jgi:replicative DNA helicase
MSRMNDYHDEYEKPMEQPPDPNFAEELEQKVLGGIIINEDAYYEAAKVIECDDFQIVRHQAIWRAMTLLKERGEPIEYDVLIEQLRSMPSKIGMKHLLEEVGGAAYLTYLSGCIGTSVYTETLAGMMERSTLRRKMVDAGNEIIRIANEEEDIYVGFEKGRQVYDGKASRRQSRSGLRPIGQGISEHFDRIEHLYNNPNVLPGIPTGFKDIDDIQDGARDTDLIILAGRPGMGKTALLLNFLINAGKAGKRGVFFSLEMSDRQLFDRVISAETGIPSGKIRDGRLTNDEWRLYVKATGALSELGISIDDTPNQQLSQIRLKCMALRNAGQLDFVFVDYLQLIGSAKSEDDRIKQVGDNVQNLKNLARELKVPIWCASQLSRAVETRQDKRPQMSDLSESGRIEQNADQILAIYRDEFYNPTTDRPNEADIIFLKNRHGATGTATLFFRKSLTQFANLTRLNINDLLEDST